MIKLSKLVKFREGSLSSKVYKSLIHMFSGSTVNSVTSLVTGYFYALFLGPGIYGIWQTAKVFQSYPVIFSFSLPFVIRRDFAIYKSEGRNDEAKKAAQLLFTYSLFVTPLIALILAAYSYLFIDEFLLKISLFVIAANYILNIITSFGDMLNKSINRYDIIAKVNYIIGGFAILSIPFVYYYGYYPLLVSVLLTGVVEVIYYIYYRPEEFGLFWDFKMIKNYIVVAFPLYLVAIASTVFGSIDRLIIASMLSFKDVGMYSLSSFISNPLTLFVSSVSLVLFTQLIGKYGGAKTPDVILKHVKIPQVLFSQLIPPILGMGLVALPLITEVFLPKYSEGVLSAQVYIFGIYFYLLAGFSSNALFVLNKQKLSAFSFLIAGIIKTTGSILLIKAEMGITGVAFSTLVAYFVYDLLMFIFIYKKLSINIKNIAIDSFHKILPAFVIALSVFLLIYTFSFFNVNVWARTILSEIFLFVISIPFFLKFKKIIKPYFS